MSPTSRHLLLLHRYQQRHTALDPQRWSLRNVFQLLSSDQLTCEDLARFCYANAVAGEDVWNLRAFSRLSAWSDIQEAALAADERRRQGTPKSLLDGIPISIKANLAVESEALTAGSRILGEDVPGTNRVGAVGYNAEIVEQLVDDCGAICIGITNMDEFGMGSLGTNTASGIATKNPLAFLGASTEDGNASSPLLLDLLRQSSEDITAAHKEQQSVILSSQGTSSSAGNTDPSIIYAAGGSSCGAAASVAHGSSMVALASDTGGSIRLPAAWCGVVGLKPSYGKMSRHGLVSYASSLDTVGFMTPTTECASVVLKELCSKAHPQSARDSTYHRHFPGTNNIGKRKSLAVLNETADRPLEGIKIGIPAAFVVEECPTEVKHLWSLGANALEEAGATLVTLSGDVVSPNVIQQSLAAYYVLASAEASSNLARYDGFRYGVAASTSRGDQDGGEGTTLKRQYAKTRSEGFGEEVIRRILCGTAVLSSDKFHTHYEAAAKLRALVTHQLHNALQAHVDYMLIPTVLVSPPRLGDDKTKTNIDNTEMFGNDIMTVPISLAGLAAVNIPYYPTKTGKGLAVDSVNGLQLVGYRLEEENLLSVARYLEHT